ncbi:tetratricopeptide repeat protein [Sphingobacterium faecale]|uniref:HTH luxR-type domain-containing protein n=1 Tax=Sphingobacterium faecale TaxID=2803775 RepID=A0ABS1R3W3_9SPHI|nr:LuxR C-terminal-related transcriptional regulator [Sphingobacterium faecale]MBL1409392.1 hypothetical protein [Sphingobacterium faecale]
MLKRTKQVLTLIYIVFCSSIAYSQHIDVDELYEHVSKLNDNNQNEQSILLLEKIINDPKSTAIDLTHAYLAKSLTYKQLYNYTGALKNLELAYQESQKTNKKEKLTTQIIIERILIHFDLKNEREYLELLKQLKPGDLQYVKKETQAYYQCILGHLELRKGNYKEADSHFEQAIALFQAETPKHLPLIYKAKVELYNIMGLHDKAIEAFEKGLLSANEHHIDIYKIMMYETMIYYYTSNKEYEKAYHAQKTVSEARRQYDAANRSGKLTLLEKELLQQRTNIEIINKRNMTWMLYCITFLLFALVFVLFRLYQSNKQRRILMEKEIEQMRISLQRYINPASNTNLSPLDLQQDSPQMTARQLQIVELVKQGKTNKEIGAALFISENTVKYHLKTIYELLDVSNRLALMHKN